MKKKIIELTRTETNDFNCIICCKKKATTKVRINRLVQDDSLTSFYVCDECLARMQKDIEVCK